MYQYGQGVTQDDSRALAWYGLAADQGNVHGKNNFQSFCDELEDQSEGACKSASVPVDDAAFAQAQRRARMQYLRGRIDGLEADALKQDSEVRDLEHMGDEGKKGAIAKVMDALGTAVAVNPALQAQKDRDEAARLRDELARLENEDRSATGVPAP